MTHHNSVSASCHTLLQRLNVLYEETTIGRGMHDLVESAVKKTAHYGEIFVSYPREERLAYGRKLVLDLLDIEALVDALSRNQRVANSTVRALLAESVRRVIGRNLNMDIVVIESQSRSPSLKSFIHNDGDELAFVLFLSPVLNYTILPFLPRVVHEAAHADRGITALCTSRMEVVFRRHLAEVL